MDIDSTLYNLKATDVTLTFLNNAFAIDSKGHREIDPERKFKLDEKLLRDAGSEFLNFKNAKELLGKETTCGRFILNLVVYKLFDTKYSNEVEKSGPQQIDVRGKFNYKDITLNAGAMNGLYKEIVSMAVNSEISWLVVEQFINNLNWVSFVLVTYLNPSMDIKAVNAGPEIRKIKKQVLDDNKDIILNNDVKRFNDVIEPAVLKQASRILDEQKSSGKIIYDSGVNGSFSNNYKLTALFRGVVPKSDDPTSYRIGLSSLTDGVSKDEISLAGDIAVQGSIARAKDTRQGGYLVKQFNSAFQSIVVDAKGSDCRTPRTISVTLTEKDYDRYLFRFIVDAGKVVQLTAENKAKYANKPLKLRSPFYCQTTKICNCCAGDMVYKLGIRNIGLTASATGSSLMNAAMKSFHSLAVKTSSYDITNFMQEA